MKYSFVEIIGTEKREQRFVIRDYWIDLVYHDVLRILHE